MRLILSILLASTIAAEEQTTVLAWVTAYCPCRKCCGKHADGKTATGKRCVNPIRMEDHWGIAADWRAVPKGSRIIIPGYKPSRYYAEDHAWPVDDTGGAMIRSWETRRVIHLDVRFINHSSARRWKSGWYEVTITKEKP